MPLCEFLKVQQQLYFDTAIERQGTVILNRHMILLTVVDVPSVVQVQCLIKSD